VRPHHAPPAGAPRGAHLAGARAAQGSARVAVTARRQRAGQREAWAAHGRDTNSGAFPGRPHAACPRACCPPGTPAGRLRALLRATLALRAACARSALPLPQQRTRACCDACLSTHPLTSPLPHRIPFTAA
jgi:hypothetical protein